MANKNERTPDWVLQMQQERRASRRTAWIVLAVVLLVVLAVWRLVRGGL